MSKDPGRPADDSRDRSELEIVLHDRIDELERRGESDRKSITRGMDREDGLQATIVRLKNQGEIDRASISDGLAREDALTHEVARLESAVETDHKMIATLRADGETSRSKAEHLQDALKASRKIGAAIGILMHKQRLTEEAAFALLVETSQAHNRKLRAIADDVVLTGEIPPKP